MYRHLTMLELLTFAELEPCAPQLIPELITRLSYAVNRIEFLEQEIRDRDDQAAEDSQEFIAALVEASAPSKSMSTVNNQ